MPNHVLTGCHPSRIIVCACVLVYCLALLFINLFFKLINRPTFGNKLLEMHFYDFFLDRIK